ncbi:hypothetical protein D3C79_1078000 [compost metagenome]
MLFGNGEREPAHLGHAAPVVVVERRARRGERAPLFESAVLAHEALDAVGQHLLFGGVVAMHVLTVPVRGAR